MIQRGKVKKRTLSSDGSDICIHNDNPLINAFACDVEFEDGDVREHMANIIGEHILARADTDCHITMSLQAILNHRKNDTAHELKAKNFYVNN